MTKKPVWPKVLLFIGTHLTVAVMTLAAVLLASSLTKDPGQKKLERLAGYIERYHVDDPAMTDVYDMAARGMVAGTGDRWSYYISAAEMAQYDQQKNNAYVGVGITVQEQEDGTGILVQGVTAGGPAQEAGILPGDIIIKVDDAGIEELGVSGLSDKIRGEEGTVVKLTVLRDEEELEFTITRKLIEVKVAEGQMLEGNIGYVKIANFNEKCAAETILAVEELVDQGATSLVFDVRNNGGGYKDELVKILDYLLPEGDLFKSVDYTGYQEVDTSDSRCLRMPMAVLINGESYSAAEFFAAALEEYGWAITGGEPTVGKGHMQVTFDLKDGSAVALSIGRYLTPNDVDLEAQGGLVPQVHTPVDEETAALIASGLIKPAEDPQLQAVIQALTGKSEEKP